MTNMAAGSGNLLSIVNSDFQNNLVELSGLGGAVAVDTLSLLLEDVVFNHSEVGPGRVLLFNLDDPP
jgi:hypothetical protein